MGGKMNDEQRVAMASLNEEAKKCAAERDAYDEAKKEKKMEEIEICAVVDLKKEQEAGIKRAHEQGGPDGSDFTAAVEAMCGLEDERIFEHLGKAIEVHQGLRYTQSSLAVEMDRVFHEEIMALRSEGQKEYAHDDSSPFANFERGAADMGIDRKQVLWVYAMKHKDGIAAHLKGHKSQREDVRGRVNDFIVYLLLLRGILNEEAGNTGNFGLGDQA